MFFYLFPVFCMENSELQKSAEDDNKVCEECFDMKLEKFLCLSKDKKESMIHNLVVEMNLFFKECIDDKDNLEEALAEGLEHDKYRQDYNTLVENCKYILETFMPFQKVFMKDEDIMNYSRRTNKAFDVFKEGMTKLRSITKKYNDSLS